ncbi:MAG TPA: archaemetzincin family Zn-dependent metalloprotease [Thermoanaerobaculia bacterium]|jgi:archaemetzincin|nr:archaemetzincin family Zn-dependent metalloprotease [Thermoanaerobaculia bacterium]
MRSVEVVAIGNPRRVLLDAVRSGIEGAFGVECRESPLRIDPRLAYHAERNQYHSTELLHALLNANGTGTALLGLTDVDLFIPILTFVFGEAQLGGSVAVISHHRLHQEFYGLPADDGLLRERTVKEAIHELGHVAGLTHCEDYDCVMAASHAVEWLDVKGKTLCPHCRKAV